MTAQRIDSPNSVRAELVELANELVGRIWAHFTARAAELNLTVAEAKALQHLNLAEPMPMRALAARLHASPSNVTVVVDRMEARGLVKREVSLDRRVKGVRLSQLGLDLRCRLESRLLTEHPAVDGLSDADQRTLLRILRRINARA